MKLKKKITNHHHAKPSKLKQNRLSVEAETVKQPHTKALKKKNMNGKYISDKKLKT